jgi:hypothetical protein
MSQTRENCCQGKVRHKDRTGAIIALKKMKNAQLSAYQCPYCHGWHLGHSHHPMKIQARLDQLIGPWPQLHAPRPPRG